VPVIRVEAVAATALALLALAVTAMLEKDKLDALTSAIVEAALWSGFMIFVLPRVASAMPPVPVTTDQLPPTAPLWKKAAPSIVFMAGFEAAAVAYSLFAQQYFGLGVALALPILIWVKLRRAGRTERELYGQLWTTAGLAWTSKSHTRYIVLTALD
jgi:hypothetical protein